VFLLLETTKPERKPDNTLTMEINGTMYIIDEYLSETSETTINDFVGKWVKRDFNPAIPSGKNG
jgi:uncharacterized protein YlzI (FlbEa/FlbD family)